MAKREKMALFHYTKGRLADYENDTIAFNFTALDWDEMCPK